MKKVKFALKNKESICEVFSGFGLEKEIISYLKRFKAKKFAIVTDSKVNDFHTKSFYEKLQKEGINCILIVFPEGEKNKNRETKAYIEDKMFEAKLGRDGAVIAFGGGVTGDMAGFVAGTYMRGIPVIQIPTTTVSIADSSYGGKTGIDVPAGKNLIGVYHQPVAVFMDAKYLSTLDERNYVSGLIESIKHGWIKSKKFYEAIKSNKDILLERKGKKYEKVMERLMMDNIKIKRSVVVSDPTENNLRKILNYGHTIGHAVEKLSGFSLLHGEAIAIGISAEAYLAYKTKISTKECYLEQKNFIESIGLSTRIPENISTNSIMELMKVDKKARDSTPEFTLIKSIGKYAVFDNGYVAKRFDAKELESIINEYRKEEN